MDRARVARTVSCEACSVVKARCVRASEGEPCERCTRLRRACRVQDTTLTRRKREELRRAERSQKDQGEEASSGGGHGSSLGSGFRPRSQSASSQSSGSVDGIVSGSPPDASPASGPSQRASPEAAVALAKPRSRSPRRPIVKTEPPDEKHTYYFIMPGARSGPAAAELLVPAYAPPADGPASLTISIGDRSGTFLSEASHASSNTLSSAGFSADLSTFQLGSPAQFILPEVSPVPRALNSFDNTSGIGLMPLYVSQALIVPHSDVLPACIVAYFDYYNKRNPLIHRGTFLRAFTPPGSPRIYGPNPPLALLFAVAAAGSGQAEVPGLSDTQRIRAGREFANRARELVLSGYFDRPPGMRAMTDLETMLVLLVLSGYFVPAGLAAHMFPMQQRMVALLAEVCVDGPEATVAGADDDPADATEWVLREMKTRAFAFISVMDCMAAPTAGRQPLYPYFRHPIRFPAHDGYYEMEDEELAFQMLHRSPDGPAPPRFDSYRELYSSRTPPARRAELIRTFLAPSFEGRAFVGNLLLMHAFMCTIKVRQRALIRDHGIGVMRLALQDRSLDTPPEAAYRRLEEHVAALYGDIWAAIPGFGAALGAGDPGPFLRTWPSVFSAKGHAHSFLATCVAFTAFPLERYVLGDPSAAPDAFFASEHFLAVLGGASVAVGLLRGQLADDPGMRWAPVAEMAAVLRAGYVLLGAARAAGVKGGGGDPLGYAEDLKVVARAMDSLGRAFRPLGTRLARDFRRLVLAVGIDPDAPAPPEEDDEPVLEPMPVQQLPAVPESSAPAAFARMAMSGGDTFKPWVK
ncbi:hypothetical protein DFJ74DRAFT_771550 [Hyaloraphidium curvatum]|nr:hypothetical protein DFJ74DRAFT_771550 [Hyaloraphidium curvatum]